MQRQLLISRLVEHDPITALGYARSLNGGEMQIAEQTVMTAWVEKDPDSAARHFEENLDDFRGDTVAAGETVAAIASAWAKSNAEASLVWAQGLQEEFRDRALNPVLAALGRSDPDRVSEIINSKLVKV